MKRLLWILAWIAVAVWSLFAWGAYGLLDFFGASPHATRISSPATRRRSNGCPGL